ncbi:hypothetical protein GCV60_15155 [Listeria monocytogenes]|nr:hypothetical protein [Listeria monocytogenes]HAO6010112.1 hypothetical protein [Listeria monocytogenes]
MTTTKRYASLDSRKKNPLTKTTVFLMTYLVILAVEYIIIIAFYDKIPNVIPYQWSSTFQIEQTAKKSILTVSFIPVIQTFILVIFVVVNKLVGKSRIQILASEPLESLDRIEKYRKFMSKFLFLIFLLVQLNLFLVNMMICFQTQLFKYTLILGMVLLFLVTIRQILKIIGLDNQSTSSSYKSLRVNEDNSGWKNSWLYVNKEDSSFVIEKRYGFGYTLNFARFESWIFLLFVILIIVGILIFSFVVM